MKKRVLGLFLILCIVASTITVFPAFAAEVITEPCGDNVTWTFDNGVLTVSGTGDIWTKDERSTKPPWERTGIDLTKVIINEGVTGVGSFAFFNCLSLTSVTLPSTIITIGASAFSGCPIESITLPEGLISIGENGFKGCAFTELVLPDSVTSIGGTAFYCCKNLKSVKISDGLTELSNGIFEGCDKLESVTFGKNIEAIGSKAFSGCDVLNNITLPTSLTTIKDFAFDWCSALTSIVIPENVTMVAEGAFNYCRKLTDITLPDRPINFGAAVEANNKWYNTNTFFCSGIYNDKTKWENGVLYIGDHLVAADKSTATGEITVKEGVKYIADFAFKSCKNITKITLPDSLVSVNYHAFDGCSALMDVIATGNNVKNISNEAFYNSGFYNDETKWEDGVLYAGACLIKANEDVSRVEIKSGTTTIADYAFNNCKTLTEITMPESVKVIGDYAFNRCSVLKSTKIHNKVEYIGDCAYQYCNGIDEIVIPDSVTYLGEDAFRQCLGAKKLDIGSGITEIKSGTFGGIAAEVISIPLNITAIGSNAFSGCKFMTSLTIGSNVKTIDDYAFYLCNSLVSVIIPDSVVSMGMYAIESTSVKSITIGKGLKDAEKAFVHVSALEEFIVSDENPYFSSQDGVLFNKDKTLLITYPNGKEENEYIVPDGVVTIGWGAFYGRGISSVVIPDSVVTIGKEAFSGCWELTDVTFGNGLEVIDDRAFGNIGVEELIFPNSLKKIGWEAFYRCNYLYNITFGNKLELIDEYAFANCGYLGEVNLPDSSLAVAQNAFFECEGLMSVTVPKSVQAIANRAFYLCENLKEIVVSPQNASYCSVDGSLFTKDMHTLIQYAIGKDDTEYTVPDGVKEIGDYAFYGSPMLEQIIMPNGLKTIGDYAFANGESLYVLYIPGSVNEILGDDIAENCPHMSAIYFGAGEEEWENIGGPYRFEDYDVWVNYGYIHYDENIKIQQTETETVAQIEPPYEMISKTLVVGLYKGGILTAVRTVVCSGDMEEFNFTEDYDEIRIMYWNDLISGAPLTDAEIITTNDEELSIDKI